VYFIEGRKSVGRRITLRWSGKKTMVDILNDGSVHERKCSRKCIGKILEIEKKRNLRSATIRLRLAREKKGETRDVVENVIWDVAPESVEDSAKFEAALLNIPHLNMRFNLLQTILAFPSNNILGLNIPKNVINLVGFYINS